MSIVPLVFPLVVVSIARLGSAKSVGRLAGKALLYFEIVTTAILVLTLGLAVLTGLGKGDLIAVLFFAVFLGLALTRIGGRATPVIDVLDGQTAAMFQLISWIVRLTPLAVVFLAHAYGVELTLPKLVAALLVLMVLTKGIAGVPSASIVVLFSASATIGLPAEGVSILLVVDFVVDMARTALNVSGNALATVVIAKSKGLYTAPASRAAAEVTGRVWWRRVPWGAHPSGPGAGGGSAGPAIGSGSPSVPAARPGGDGQGT